jgi:hypothetical protein
MQSRASYTFFEDMIRACYCMHRKNWYDLCGTTILYYGSVRVQYYSRPLKMTRFLYVAMYFVLVQQGIISIHFSWMINPSTFVNKIAC